MQVQQELKIHKEAFAKINTPFKNNMEHMLFSGIEIKNLNFRF